jgi:heat shock protein 4
MVTKSAVIGIDIGASESLVSFVGKGIVDIVQNEVSKRATSTLVGFTDRERLLGDAALATIKSNAKNTCRNFKHLLGRPLDAPDVEKEKFWSTSPLATAEDGNTGYDVTYKGEGRVFSSPQITAMCLTKLRDITESWCQSKVADAVISVPGYFADVHRQALLDAAKIAGISVLRLMNEHTATALSYGIYRSNDFDAEKPCTVAFCSMGHTLFSVSIVQFVKGKLTVVCEKSDKVGGRDMDECLMRVFAEQFQKKFGCDPLSNKKAAFKLEDAVGKTKKILSSNNEAGVNVECLMEDEDFSSNMNRDDFEKMCQPMMDKVKAVLEGAKALCSVPVDQIDFVEIVGGAIRVPWVKRMCSEAFGGKELSTTMNQEESVCRGCALQAAILSPLYKVRDFKVEECSAYSVNIGWMGSSADAEAKKTEDEEGDTQMTGAEGEYKTTTVFPAGSQMGVVKMLTFYRKGPFDVKAEYADPSTLPPKTPKELGTYKIELPAQIESKKVKVKAKLNLSGCFTIESAQMVEDEEYEETVKEKRELPPEEPQADENAGDANMEGEKKEGEEKKDEKKEPEKKYEWVDVVKKKKRTKRTDLKISISGVPGLSEAVLAKRQDEETAMQVEMKEIIETDEKRNDLEGYIFNMRDKITESGEYGSFISQPDREKFESDLMKAEDWLYDNEGATKVQYMDKLDELKALGDPLVWRYKEDGMRGEWIEAVLGTVRNYRAAAENPGEKYGHIAADKLAKIVAKCTELEAWLTDLKAKQDKLSKTERPLLICADMEKKNQELAKFADEILKEPKPAPPKEEKKEEKPAEAPKEGEGGDGPQNMDVD